MPPLMGSGRKCIIFLCFHLISPLFEFHNKVLSKCRICLPLKSINQPFLFNELCGHKAGMARHKERYWWKKRRQRQIKEHVFQNMHLSYSLHGFVWLSSIWVQNRIVRKQCSTVRNDVIPPRGENGHHG